jgi:hypothetical protein
MRDRSASQPRAGLARINLPLLLGIRIIARRNPNSDGGRPARSIQRCFVDCEYRIDLLGRGELSVEIKSVEVLLPIHQAQILTYMQLANVLLGLLINFNVTRLQTSIKRFVL